MIHEEFTGIPPINRLHRRWVNERNDSAEQNCDDQSYCADNPLIWNLDEVTESTALWDTATQSHFMEYFERFKAINAGRDYIGRGHFSSPQTVDAFVVISRQQLDALIHRLETLEVKAGLGPKTTVEIPAKTESQLEAIAKSLFSSTPTIETKDEPSGDGVYYRVLVKVRDIDPDVIAAKQSEWHDLIMASDIPKELRDNIRLKVTYE